MKIVQNADSFGEKLTLGATYLSNLHNQALRN